MKFKLLVGPKFRRELKRLVKKYASIESEVEALFEELRDQPLLGTPIGRNCYKIRLAIASKGRGKSGGVRVITYVAVVQETVYLLTMYDKSEQATLAHDELDALLAQLEAATG